MSSEASQPKKLKTSNDSDPESSEWFTCKRYPSDVTLKFDDEHSLYVSKKFLMYSSPVFEAMFNHEMKEKKTGIIDLKGKSSTDFLELLLCLHPRVGKQITPSNVHSIAKLANEYQIRQLLARCKTVITDYIRGSVNEPYRQSVNTMSVAPSTSSRPAVSNQPFLFGGPVSQGFHVPIPSKESILQDSIKWANRLLKYLVVVRMINEFASIVSEIVEKLSKIKSHCVDGDYTLSDPALSDILKENQSLFASLDDELQKLLYKARLKKVDKE